MNKAKTEIDHNIDFYSHSSLVSIEHLVEILIAHMKITSFKVLTVQECVLRSSERWLQSIYKYTEKL